MGGFVRGIAFLCISQQEFTSVQHPRPFEVGHAPAFCTLCVPDVRGSMVGGHFGFSQHQNLSTNSSTQLCVKGPLMYKTPFRLTKRNRPALTDTLMPSALSPFCSRSPSDTAAPYCASAFLTSFLCSAFIRSLWLVPKTIAPVVHDCPGCGFGPGGQRV